MHRLDLPTNSIPRKINVKFSARTFINFEVTASIWLGLPRNYRIGVFWGEVPKCTLNGLFTFIYILSKLLSNEIRGGRRQRDCKIRRSKFEVL